MKTFPNVRTQFLVGSIAALALGVIAAEQASAALVSYVVDPARSSYHIVNLQTDGATPPAPLQDSTILAVPVIPQSLGADTAALSGTIKADLTGGVLTFSGTSTIAV